MSVNQSRFAPRFVARAVMIDLDGTLIDTAADLATADNLMLHDLGRPPIDPAIVRDLIGSGIRVLVRRTLSLFTDPGEEEIDAAFEIFMRHYKAHLLDRSRPYPGTIETLRRLYEQGRVLGCVTNKLEELTDLLLGHFGLRRWFEIVLSGDSLPRRKPDPMPLFHASRVLKIPVNDMLMVGDSRTDADAASAAGVPFVCVTYGYNGGEDIREFGASVVIESFDELLGLLS
jgi:phosphoglycolate phosphatase